MNTAPASDASGKGAGKRSSGTRDTGTPLHKQLSPATHDFYDFQDIANKLADEQATLVGSKGKGKSKSMDVQLPTVSEYTDKARTLQQNLIVGEIAEIDPSKGKGAGKRTRAEQDVDHNPAPSKKGIREGAA